MRREIGSEFWDVPVKEKQNGLFLESTQWYLSGRSALHAIIKELGEIRSVSLPSWCCDSMIKPFMDAGIEVCFYPIIISDGRLVHKIDRNSDALLLMDYFGYTTSIPDLGDYKGTIIRDVTHSVFSSSYTDADYFFGSLRKWCGVWTGGYVWTRNGHRLEIESEDGYEYVALRKRAMKEKAEYINGEREDKGFLEVFIEAEEKLESIGSFPAIERDIYLAQRFDVEGIKDRRRANATVLRTAFPDWLIFPTLFPMDCPMFVPVIVPDGKRDALRRYLISNDIYCPIHWPLSEYHKIDELTSQIYENELSLVCDQRYTEDDMNRMVETIVDFMEV